MAVTPGRVLLGYMPQQEALGFLQQSCSFDGKTDADLQAMIVATRTKANIVAAELVEAPQCVPINPAHNAHLTAVQAHPLFLEATQGTNWSFRMVEARKLICIQKFVDQDRGQGIVRDLDVNQASSVLELCLPTKRYPQTIGMMANSDNSWTVFSRTLDMRITATFNQEDPITKRRSVGYHLGGGTPFIQVAAYQGRLYLKNGYHRVYELLNRGIEMVPCILIEGTKLEDTGLRPGFFPPEQVQGPNPPRVGHYLTEAACDVPLRPQTKVLRIKAEEYSLPAEAALPAVVPAPREVAPTGPPPTTAAAEYIDFKVTKPGGSTYLLADGTVVKLRQDLTRVFAPNPAAPGFKVGPVVMSVLPPRAICGLPAAAVQADAGLGFTTTIEEPGEYQLADGRIAKLTSKLQGVSRNAMLDAEGEPVYVVTSAVAIELLNPLPPPVAAAPEANQ